jgi:AcrR family transcriptional regulator
MPVGRPSQPRLSREMIVEAALRQIDSGAVLSLNKISKELGVHLSSLAHHVGDREHLIELLREHLAARYPVRYSVTATWQEAFSATATAIHEAFLAHPLLTPYLATKAITSHKVLGTYSGLAQVLSEAGFSEHQASVSIRFLDILTLGSGLEITEKANDPGARDVPTGTDPWRRQNPSDSEAAFDLALRRFIEGMERDLQVAGADAD